MATRRRPSGHREDAARLASLDPADWLTEAERATLADLAARPGTAAVLAALEALPGAPPWIGLLHRTYAPEPPPAEHAARLARLLVTARRDAALEAWAAENGWPAAEAADLFTPR